MAEQFVGLLEEYYWLWLVAVILIAAGLGVREHFRYIERQRGEAMLQEVDKYDSQEPVGGVPYNERP